MSGKTAGVLVTAAVTALCVNHFWYEIGDVFWPERKTIVATIKLDNRCEFRDFVFVVRDLNTGHYASFAGGRAQLRTQERNRVTVEFAPRYRKVEFYAPTMPVKRQMTMTTRCGSRRLMDMNWFG
tara:strand:- start:1314 stop:1688 length:375 start_codon:yes stop_codon:yes gene_type:complete